MEKKTMFQLLVVCKALTLGLNANHEILGRGVEIYANNNQCKWLNLYKINFMSEQVTGDKRGWCMLLKGLLHNKKI